MEYHQVAIHADVKPLNYVYVANGHKTLKLIDFDLSVIIPESVPIGERANFSVPPKWPHCYSNKYGPEFRDYRNVKISTKTDIWSIGILTYDLFLSQPKFNLSKEKRLEILTKITEIYRRYKWVKNTSGSNSSVQKIPKSLVYDEHWLLEYADALYFILEMQKTMPKIHIFVVNTLQTAGTHRMTIVEVWYYLNKRCKPQPEQHEDIRSGIYMGFSYASLRNSYFEMETLLKDGIINVNEEIDKLMEIHAVCQH